MPRRHRSPANCIDRREFRERLVPLPGRKDGLEIAAAKLAELARVRRHLDEVGLAAVIDEEKLPRVLRSLVIDSQRRRTGHRGPRDWAKVAGDGKFAAPDEWLPGRLEVRERGELSGPRHDKVRLRAVALFDPGDRQDWFGAADRGGAALGPTFRELDGNDAIR